MSRNGRRRGVQRFKCDDCGKQTQSARRPGRMAAALWRDHVWRRQTLAQLAEERGRSVAWTRKVIDSHEPRPKVHRPRAVFVVADATFWGRSYGVLVFRDPVRRENLWWEEISSETVEAYRRGRAELERLGYTLIGAVTDGRRGVRGAFAGIPVQSCQFHQVAAVNRHLTRRPKLEASRELRSIALRTTRLDEAGLTAELAAWHVRWSDFLKERTFDEKTGRWRYTHRRVRAAYRSMKSNLPYLYTHLRHPGMPNTTNSLDGSFSHLKERVGLHRGKRPHRRRRIIDEILGK